MNTLFSAVSGQYPKYLIFGTMLPAVIFVLIDVAVSLPIVPATLPLVRLISALDKEWFVISLTFVVILLTGFLYNLNTPIVRIYEGYTWGESWLGEWLIRVHRRRILRLSLARERLRVSVRALQRLKLSPELITRLRDRQRKIAQRLTLKYPGEWRLVQPTRLGNAIRAFEEYSRQQYGMDSIFLWPRLVAVVPKEYSSAADDAKSSFDFFLNSSVLSAIVTLQLIIMGLAFKRPFASDSKFLLWITEVLSLALVSFLSYLGAINRAIAWGGQVKGAFDLYRNDLLKQLGYKYAPPTRELERELWVEISQQIYYCDPDPTRALPLPYEELPVSLGHTPANAEVKVVYGFSRSPSAGDLDFHCPISNEDSQKRDAEALILRLRPPEGFEYVWGSARMIRGSVEDVPQPVKKKQLDFGPLRVGLEYVWNASGQSPPSGAVPKLSRRLHFELGKLGNGQEVIFKCSFMPFPQTKS